MDTDSIDILCETWNTLKEYIPRKEREIAAEHIINMLADYSFSDSELKIFAGGDPYLKEAVKQYVDEEEDDDDYEFED